MAAGAGCEALYRRGVVTSRPGSRCAVHARQSNRSRHNPLYSTREWQRLSARLIAAHVGAFGRVCPGDGPDHRAHPSGSLTVDHVIPLSAGGAALDLANLRVLCRPGTPSSARTGNALRSAVGRSIELYPPVLRLIGTSGAIEQLY